MQAIVNTSREDLVKDPNLGRGFALIRIDWANEGSNC